MNYHRLIALTRELEGAGAASGGGDGKPATGAGDGGKPDAGAGGSQGGGQGSGLKAAAEAAGKPEGDGGAPPVYFPEGLDERYKGANEREIIDRLAAEVKGKPTAPASPKDYKLELSPEVAKKFGDLSDDKVVAAWRETAHELGLDNKQFSAAFENLYGRMQKAGLIDEGPDYAKELDLLKPKNGSEKDRATGALRRITDAEAFVKGLEARKDLTGEQAAILLASAETAAGITLIEAIQKLTGGTGLVGGGQSATGDTKDGLKSLMADPRYDPLGAKYDKRFQEDVDRRWRALHGAN